MRTKGIYTYYRERLIEIGGNNKCLFLKSTVRKSSYDLGNLLMGRDDKIREFEDFLWTSNRFPFRLISPKEKKQILENLDISSRIATRMQVLRPNGEGDDAKKSEKMLKIEENRAIENELLRIREIKREAEEFERETGRYELYIGFPFVLGAIQQGPQKTLIKAPLLFFPVKVEITDENTVDLRINEAEKIQINRALVYAYAQSKRLNIDQLELDFDDLSQFKNVRGVVRHLAEAHIRIHYNDAHNILAYRFNDPKPSDELTVHSAAVLARFPIANSIYNDYTLLERQKLTNNAIVELLRNGKQKKKAKKEKTKQPVNGNTYAVKMLDSAQEDVLRRVNLEGNMVIYGPPGTGKSQTIVNIITDAISKSKRVLVVSQKKAALDVVYNRLGTLSKKAMYIVDENKEKQSFYERCLTAHQDDLIEKFMDLEALENDYSALQSKIDREVADLNAIYHTLNDKRPFGLSLSQMYGSSRIIQKNSWEYGVYSSMIESREIMALDYGRMDDALFAIRSNNLAKIYYTFQQNKEKNPLIEHLLENIDFQTLTDAQSELADMLKAKRVFFNTAAYPYYKQVLAYYYELKKENNLGAIVELEYQLTGKRKFFSAKEKKLLREKYNQTLEAIDDFTVDYYFLHKVLDDNGYLAVIDNLLRGNLSYLKYLSEALENYISLRDTKNLLDGLDSDKSLILGFSYACSKNLQNYLDIVNEFPEIRIYHELLQYEEECKNEFAKIVDFPNIVARISAMKEEQLKVSVDLCNGRNCREYDALFKAAKNADDYFYQISKKQKFWPIRKTVEVYGEFILCLFPCWLLSPENVSNLLPLQKDLFDLVIFDEASQVFIENTIPTIYRGKCIVVAGDSKQLRPSATFMKRYLGGDPELLDDYSVQAALEVESLLDLAVARYQSANLTYHYRSRSRELIDFSNNAFYQQNLQIAPNITKNREVCPITRIKVTGKWIDRRNTAEAKKIIELLKYIFDTRQNGESIGIITFNADQQACIADMIDSECAKNPEFRSQILRETHRMENGEDISLFIKNLENVQGDERDIILFSIGYAANEQGKIYSNFGSLSAEGGENRLNVAITRAKCRIIVVTSIEPEDLKVDTAKNLGPKLLQKYLQYIRSVASHQEEETAVLLADLYHTEAQDHPLTMLAPVEEQMKERLEKAGYTVDIHLGNRNSRISLAIYDKELDRYLVGVELDSDAFASSADCLERDVSKPRFLASRGWSILRVWCRDWWISPQKVVRSIITAAERNRALYIAQRGGNKAKAKVKAAIGDP